MERVLITGASRGIGLELTHQFLEQGYQVIATYRGKPSTQQQALGDYSGLTLFELEVTSDESIGQLVTHLADKTLDIVINNAGVIGPQQQALMSVDASSWQDTFAINTIAPLMISRALINNLTQAANPRIVTISSNMGSLSEDSLGMYAYRSSKAALNKVMKLMAAELKQKGITVCPVHPGWVQTDMGGESASLTVSESASGIVDVVRNLSLDQSGQFLTWHGERHPW